MLIYLCKQTIPMQFQNQNVYRELIRNAPILLSMALRRYQSLKHCEKLLIIDVYFDYIYIVYFCIVIYISPK